MAIVEVVRKMVWVREILASGDDDGATHCIYGVKWAKQWALFVAEILD
jgi:hypothetical protein